MSKVGKFYIVGQRINAYPRTATLKKALSGVFETEIVEMEKPTFVGQWNYIQVVARTSTKDDKLIVLYPVERLVWVIVFAKFFFKGQLVLDTFISTYDSIVNDRELAHPYGIKALYYSALDQIACLCGDLLIFDTKEHEAYFRSRYVIREKTKAVVIPISLELSQIDAISAGYPLAVSAKPEKFFVLFFGNYIPLQGVEYILRAFALLPQRDQYHLVMVGNGQTRPHALQLRDELKLSDVEFVPRLSHEEIIALTKKADLALGIFGDTDKAMRVIPNKLLEAMACGAPVITGRNTATEEYFHDDEEVYYCRLGDARDLAEAIARVRADKGGREKIATRARAVIEQEFSLTRLTERLHALFGE